MQVVWIEGSAMFTMVTSLTAHTSNSLTYQRLFGGASERMFEPRLGFKPLTGVSRVPSPPWSSSVWW
jgi:hypothetical protein